MHFIKADKVFNGEKFLPGQPVMALNNDFSFHAFVDEDTIEPNSIQHYEGIICPGFVNTHCHLELSHLKNKIPQHTGLPGFALEIIKQRGHLSATETAEYMQAADTEMFANGIVAVGDISNNGLSIDTKKQSPILYHTFVELIGLVPERSDLVFNAGLQILLQFTSAGLKASLAPHAPYSTSNVLIQKIADFNSATQTSFSIHNQESMDETAFFMGQKNGFEKLYEFLKLDISRFKAPGCSSLQDYGQHLQNTPSVLVHNTVTNKQDIDFVSEKNVFWCLCPKANLYIENALPDFSLFTPYKNKLCIGTDSLASNTSLNLMEEANIILSKTKLFKEEDILRMITLNGAMALGLEDSFGKFISGKNTGINLVNFKNSQLNFIKKIA